MASLVDPLLSQSISSLTAILVSVINETANFKPELVQLCNTLQRIKPIIEDIEKSNQILDPQSDMYKDAIKDAQKLVPKCSKIRWNIFKRYIYSLKLKDVNNKLLRFFQLEGQADQTRDLKQLMVEVRELKQKVDDKQNHVQAVSNISRSISSRKLGWCVPILPGGIVAFVEPLKKLKVKILADESSVVVVAAPGGCGKTTLVTMLCHDPDIQDHFGENIFFVTVSETPNFKVIVNVLFNPDPSSQATPFQSDEDAKNKLGNFLLEKASSPVLLVVDDVWDDSFIDSYFPLNIKGCKILVTSRMVFPKYDVFKFDPLSDKDAVILFSNSAFGVSEKRSKPTIDGDLVNQIVKSCKKHPLTLRVVGRFLNGKDESEWRYMLKNLSRGSSVVDLNEQVRNQLERSFTKLDNELKECYMDFGLFPEDQRIPAGALIDMWVHLYKHDDEGLDTVDKIVKLSFRNLVNLVATSVRNDSGDQPFITQHDLLRELAIHLSSKPGVHIAQRKRLIITARGEDLPASVLQVEEPMQASILSISTGESFSSKWGDMKVPEVEVMVLNLNSKKYTLPHFMEEMQKLKILNVTNYGLYLTYIESFDLLGFLSNLSRIRLERVVVPPMSTSILELENLQKVSFIMCQIGNAFETELASDNLKVWPSLVELDMNYCQDLKGFPGLLCRCVNLRTMNITNCNEMCEISEEFGKLTNLENLSLQSCTKLEKLPESITRLQKLRILDISDCLSLSELPTQMGKLGGLRTIYMKGCTGISELPSSLEELSNTQVLCSDDIHKLWLGFHNVKTSLVEEDRLATLMKII